MSRGKSPKYSEERLFPVFAQKCNLKDGGISLDQARFLDPSTIGKWGVDYKLKSGDVLVNSTGTGTVGRTRLFDECCLGEYPFVVPDSHVSVVRTVTEIDSFYICAILSSNWGQQYLEDNLAGSTNQKELYIGVLEDMFIPLPPKNEQKKIAKEIARWEKYVDNIDVVKAELSNHVKQTKSKILDLAISGKLVPQGPNDEPAIELLKRINPGFKPCDNSHYENLPQGWVKLRLGDVCSFERGITFPSSAKCTIKQPGLIACIRTANVQDNLELDDLWYVGNEYIKGNTEKLIRKNDIIMSSANSRELVGKVSYVHDIPEEMTFGGFVLNIRANEGILPFFLFLMLKTLYLKGYYLTIATQTTNIANLNTKILGDIEVLLPPLTEQERIINSVTDILASIENITVEL